MMVNIPARSPDAYARALLQAMPYAAELDPASVSM
jgi:hypothetical protein